MSIQLRLADILAQGEAALRALSPSIAQKVFVLDWSSVAQISVAELDALLNAAPPEWAFEAFAEVVAVETLEPSVAEQLAAWIGSRGAPPPALRDPDAPPASPEVERGARPSTARPRPALAEPSPQPAQHSRLHPLLALRRVTDEYRAYLQTEFCAKDPTLKDSLEAALGQERFLAQNPFFQAHRPFRAGHRWDELGLDPRLAEVMRRRSGSAHAYQHQSEAIRTLLAHEPLPVAVTTGTGSGKTEAFLLPVIQNAIADASVFNRRAGLTAILIYPMNALANDQFERIRGYLDDSGWSGAVEVAQYDRSTNQQRRRELRERPPHILLTNYVMLEYLLVRPADRDAIFANHRCRFLVLDEVHTYRGTLGSNIALLVRRLRAHLAEADQSWLTSPPPDLRARRFPNLVPVATSATIKSIADERIPLAERRLLRDEAVQQFVGQLSGVTPSSIRVIGEELEELNAPADAAYSPTPTVLPPLDPSNQEGVRQALCALAGVPADTAVDEAARRCKVLWDLNRLLIHQPLSLEQIAVRLRSEVPERAGASADALRAEAAAALLVGAALPADMPGALRLRAHQLVRGGWQFHRCVNPDCGRLYPMGEATCADCGYSTAPLYLCRSCGAHYLRFVGDDPSDPEATPLRPSAIRSEGPEWMLYEPARFPDTVGELDGESDETPAAPQGNRKQPKQLKGRNVFDGSFDPHSLRFSQGKRDYPLEVLLSPARTLCLCCGATLGSRNVITPVALGTSAAVKVMAEGMVEALADMHRGEAGHDGKERLLVFSDSRQDAAHQARFITFAGRYDRMRRRVSGLLKDGAALPLRQVVEQLANAAHDHRDSPLTETLVANQWLPDEQQRQIKAYEEAPLLDELALNAGYRATIFNLGLARVVYQGLDDYVEARGGALAEQLGISPEGLSYLCRCVLDEVRTRGCLSRELLRYDQRSMRFPGYLRAAEWERRVKSPQGYPLDPSGQPILYAERTDMPTGVIHHNVWRKPGSGGRGASLGRIATRIVAALSGADLSGELMLALLSFLTPTFLAPQELFGAAKSAQLLQLNADIVYLQRVSDLERIRCAVCSLSMPGARAGLPCPRCHGRLGVWPAEELRTNRTVQRILADTVTTLTAAEHTAQVPTGRRAEIEQQFKAALGESPLNLLACSPTLEMGIDVGGLDAVIMRNVPPRPDNYAQRGGRAGRRTRVGLVLGYARSTPHDQYFYDKPAEMIAGEVPAPALALGNRDTLLRHLNAIAVGAAEPGLAGKMQVYVNVKGEIDQQQVDALITGVRAQFGYALKLAQEAWGDTILSAAGLTIADLRSHLDGLPARIQDVIDRTARQVVELRQAVQRFVDFTYRQPGKEALRAADLIGGLLGATMGNGDGDDRSSGYPLRRFAEFGLLPGYEFPSEPATLRLMGDAHEDDPISVARRFGIAQFQPEATVYARGKRWKVIGLDTASPWNSRSDSPDWLYRQCRRCGLRFDADSPTCPRCKSAELGRGYPAAQYGGFLAVRDESPVLDEEERYAVSNSVVGYPQWDGNVIGRWVAGPGWGERLSSNEEVRWLNEGPPPGSAEREGGALLTEDAAGYRLCASCGRILSVPPPVTTGKGARRQPRVAGDKDPFGHGPNCPAAGQPPQPMALMTTTRAEVLRLLAPIPDGAPDDDILTWGVTLGYALRLGLRHRYMLDGPEIEFLLEGPWTVEQHGRTFRQMSLSIIDASVGGSGYLQRIAEEFHLVAQRAIEHLDHPNCTTACYRCLKSYENQRYHDLLRWPRIIADLHMLAATPPEARPLERGDIDDPGPWLEAYAAGVGSPLELRFLRLFEANGFQPQKQVPVSPDDGPAISVADFAVPERRLAIYIDGAAFHRGGNRARDAHLRDALRHCPRPWTVVELQAADLARGARLVADLKV